MSQERTIFPEKPKDEKAPNYVQGEKKERPAYISGMAQEDQDALDSLFAPTPKMEDTEPEPSDPEPIEGPEDTKPEPFDNIEEDEDEIVDIF